VRRLGRWRFMRVKVSGLQRSLRWLGGRLTFFTLFAALQALAHPFAHVGLVTQRQRPEQFTTRQGISLISGVPGFDRIQL
jgi:hypothetical protein